MISASGMGNASNQITIQVHLAEGDIANASGGEILTDMGPSATDLGTSPEDAA